MSQAKFLHKTTRQIIEGLTTQLQNLLANQTFRISGIHDGVLRPMLLRNTNSIYVPQAVGLLYNFSKLLHQPLKLHFLKSAYNRNIKSKEF